MIFKEIKMDLPVKENSKYAPAERLSLDELETQISKVNKAKVHLIQEFLDATTDMFIVLNDQRQIVFANKACLDFQRENNGPEPYGLRVGELLGCKNSFNSSGGCGTSDVCQFCAGTNAFMDAQKGNEGRREVLLFLREPPGHAMDFRLWAKPIQIGEKNFVAYVLRCISDEKRRVALEKIFFHDVMNIANELHQISELFKMGRVKDIDKLMHLFADSTEALTEEIKAQRMISYAEHNDLKLSPQEFRTCMVAEEVCSLYRRKQGDEGKTVVISTDFKDLPVVSDKTIVRRILGNMVKNALEAIKTGQEVTLGCCSNGTNVIFSVNNPGMMPEHVQRQVFNRSFSSKGVGRGLGTYSIRLLTEKYLKGRAWFTSNESEGTTFFIEIPAGNQSYQI